MSHNILRENFVAHFPRIPEEIKRNSPRSLMNIKFSRSAKSRLQIQIQAASYPYLDDERIKFPQSMEYISHNFTRIRRTKSLACCSIRERLHLSRFRFLPCETYVTREFHLLSIPSLACISPARTSITIRVPL